MKANGRIHAARFVARWLVWPLAALAAPAWSCTPALPLDSRAAYDAKQVFVFQLKATRLASPPKEIEGTVYGDIRVLKVLRGSAPISPGIRYYTGPCGGTRLDTGHYYAAFVKEAKPGWWVNSGTVIHLGGVSPQDEGTMAELRKIMEGRIALERSPLFRGRDFVESGWPPPPPLPPAIRQAKPRAK